jgi:uncharacterized protein (DUF2236 family)
MEVSRSWCRRRPDTGVLVRMRRRVGLDLPPLEEGRSGDPGLFGPESEVWRVGRERVLLLGGPAALLLQLAHPLVASGVAEHSGFRDEPFDRLRATLDATLRISFGDKEQAAEAAARVRATHRSVQGRLRAGIGPFQAAAPYTATDPWLALWVHATLVSVAMATYELMVGSLSWARRERYYEEAARFARLFRVTDEVLPATYTSFVEYLRSMERSEVLTVGDQARSLAALVLDPPLPSALRLSRPALRALTAAILPDRLRLQFGLGWGFPERALAEAAGRAIRGTIRFWPHRVRYWEHYRMACHRVGRPWPGE